MARNRPCRVGFALALLVTANLSVVSSEDKCKTGCQGSSQTFKYIPGTTYKYNLEGVVDVSVSSAEGQQTSTKLRGSVLLTALPQCDFLLRLQTVQVIGPDGKKYSNIPGIEKPVRFNFNDGIVDASICAEHGDNQNSLNIKRAAISLFQAAIKHHHETDVFGLCPTSIQTRNEGPNFVVQKSRFLNKCAYRENIKQDFMATAFNLNSEIKSSPILNGDYTAEQRFKNGVLDHAVVTENYLYLPFSVGNNGAKATVSTKIQFVGTGKDAATSKCSEPRSIIFESPHLVNTEVSNVDSISTALRETKNTIGLTVGERSARDFLNLIKILRVSKKDDILAVYGQVRAGAGFKDKVGTKQVFLDALFRAGTGETVEVAIELLKNKELTPVEQKLVYLGLAFVKHATLSSLTAASALLDQPNLPREAYLGIGILAGRYCKEHSCKSAQPLEQLTQKLLTKLGDGKPANRKAENEIISVLKALGNFENLSDTIVPKLVQIAQDKKAPNRLRIAALDTYVSHACVDKIRDSALSILKDIQQDSEIRIKAYLVVAQCPNGKIASAIKQLLDQEPSYQVGGFITSHLRNLRASASPEKAAAKQQLGQISTTNRFPIDLRKYSFNSELSYAIDSLGLASTVETNVIYSYNSFLPQSLNLNLTVDLFGNSFNALDIGIRQENLNRVLEHYFGPLGEFSSASSDDLLKTGKDTFGKLLDHFQQRVAKTKGKREASKADIDAISKQVQIKTNELNKDVDLDLSIKMFGSEFLFLSLSDESQKFTIDSLIDKIFDEIDSDIAKAKDFDKVLQTNVLFLDSEFSYPTALGYALRLTVEGSSSVQIKAASKVDIKDLFNSQKAPLKLTLIPSVSLEVSGSLLVDAQVLENGLKVASTLYAATGGDLDVKFLEGKGVDVKFSLPVEDQKILSATHEIVFNTRELGKPEVVVPLKFGQNKDFNICLDQLSSVIGTTLCIDLNNPPTTGKPGTLPFPLSGNGKFAVGIHRDDLSHFHYSHVFHTDPDKLGAEVVFEAVGTRQDKKLNAVFEVCFSPELFVKASVTSPIKSASIEGRVTNNNQEKSVSVTVQNDDQKIVAKAGLAVSGGGSKTTYKPILYYDGPGTQGQGLPVKVDGAITVEQAGGSVKYNFEDVRLSIPNQQTFAVKGLIGSEPGAFFSDISVSNGKDTGSLNGRIQFHPDVKVYAEVKSSINPNSNFKVDYTYKRQPHQVDTSFLLVHGSDLNSKTNRLTASTCFMYKRKGTYDFEGKTEAKLAYPLLGVDGHFLHAVTPKNIKLQLDLGLTEIKFGSSLDFAFNQKTSGDYVLGFEVYGKDCKIRLDATREIVGEKSQVTNCLDINGKKIEVNGVIAHHSKPDDINVGADVIVKLPGRSEPLKVQNGFILNPSNFDTHLKVASGSEVYVDLFFKSTKDRTANGNIKIAIREIVFANGEIAVKNGVGKGFVIFDLVQAKRKLKVDSNFAIEEPVYKVDLTLFFNYEADNKNKWYFSTNTNAKEDFVDSKNVAEFQGNKFELNFKADGKLKLYNSKFVSEADLTLPSNECILVKWNRDLQSVNGVVHGNGFVSIEKRENKNKPGCKAVIKGDIKQVDLQTNLYDVNYSIVSESPKGELINLDITAKRYKQDEHVGYDECLKIKAPWLQQPIEVTHTLLYKDHVGSFTLKSTGGHNILIKGKYDNDDSDNKVFGEITGDINLAYKSLKVVKFSVLGSQDHPQEHETHANAVFSLFIDDDGTKPEATIDYKVQAEAFVKPESTRVKGGLNVGKEDPISFDYGYALKKEGDVNKIFLDALVQYAHDKVVKTELCAYQPTPNEYNLDVSFDSPYAPNNKIQAYTKKSADGQILNGEFVIITDKRKFVLNSELVLIETSPGFTVKFIYPDGKTDIVSAKLSKITPYHYNGDVKVVLVERDLVFENTFDAKLESIDNFHVKVAANSPALKLDNFVLEAQNVPSKTGKRIQVVAKCAGSNILAGSTNYNAREEAGKYIVEGSGSFKVYQETKQANFKFVSHKLTEAKHGEDGLEVSFNAGLGTGAIDAEFKTTNKHFRFLNSYCEEKQQCANIEIDSKVNVLDGTHLSHELELAVDLRKLGFSHEFGLKSQTTRKTLALDHTVDMYFQQKENKYQYSVNIHPNDAGVTLTTPKRIIAFEANLHSTPQGKGNTVKGEIALYLNKKLKPNEKTALTFLLESNPPAKKQAYTDGFNAIVKFVNPALGRDLSVSYVVKYDLAQLKTDWVCTIDIFPNPAHKIVVNMHTAAKLSGVISAEGFIQAKSEGLKFDVKLEELEHYDTEKYQLKYSYSLSYNVGGSKFDSAYLLEADPSYAKLFVKALNKEIVNVNTQIQNSKDSITANTNVVVLGVEPTSTQLEVNLNSAKFTAWRTSNPNNKLVATAGVSVDSNKLPASIDLCADVWKGNQKIDLFKWVLHVDPSHFLQGEPNVNVNNIKESVVTPTQKDVRKFLDELKLCLDGAIRDTNAQTDRVVAELKKNVPNLRPVKEYYQKELESLLDELMSDKTIKEISDFVKHVLGVVVHAASDVFGRVSSLIEKVMETVQQQFARVIELISKEIVPEISEAAQKVLKIGSEIFEKLTDLFFVIASNIDTFLKQHQREIQQITGIFGGVWQDVIRVFYGVVSDLQRVLDKEWDNLGKGLKKFTRTLEDLGLKYQKILSDTQIPEMILHTLKEVAITVKDAVPIDEVKRLISAIIDYVEKKCKNQRVDDVTALQNIFTLAVQSVGKVFDTTIATTKGQIHNLPEKSLPVFSLQHWYNVPLLTGIRFSPISYLAYNDLTSVLQGVYAFSLNPVHWFPPYQLDALVVQGQHIFTFDGKHITFPGNCNYLLARDAYKGRFSIIGTLTNGILTEITFVDKIDTITIKKGGQVFLNGAPAEFPIRSTYTHAYRLYESVNIASKADVRITCGPELVACGIHLSGYYHGDVRGLLGNGNSEPFDDFILASGKIVPTETEFCNSYQVGANCPPVAPVDHKHNQPNPTCTKWFSSDSPLSACFKFVKPENYRVACEHGLAAGVPDTEESLVTGYIASCGTKFIPIKTPKEFLKCTTGEQVFTLGETFSVKTPRKAADIVLVIDQAKANEVVFKELIQPLALQLTTELNAHAITDINFHVIGFGGKDQQYVSHYTVGGQLTCKAAHLPNVQFTEVPRPTFIATGCDYLDALQRFLYIVKGEIDLLTFQTPQTKAYLEVKKYPFRPHAVKAVIGFASSACEKGLGLIKLRTAFMQEPFIKISMLQPFDSFNTKDPKNTKNVIGFNPNGVFTFTDARKKPEGDSELLKELEFDDICADYILKNGGNVFVANNFLQSKPPQRKQFAFVAAHNIAHQLVNTEQGLDCECTLVTPYTALNTCKVVYSREKEVVEGGATKVKEGYKG